ncbi:MAG: class I SAM-dependent methyltransferase [Anaerolineales bacterium]|nr:class I SAM-dependent methyltransferase [Anaerolineales bacterium]
MDHFDHVNLLRPANLNTGGIWADFGAGGGAFTLALRELIGPEAIIHAVDKDRSALKELDRAHRARFPLNSNLLLLPADFSRPLTLPPLDGIVMANSLHYFKDRVKVLQHVRTFLKPDGQLLLVEYNVDSGNLWVPYPFSFDTFRTLAVQSGFTEPQLLAKHPSSFLKEFYSAVCTPQV